MRGQRSINVASAWSFSVFRWSGGGDMAAVAGCASDSELLLPKLLPTPEKALFFQAFVGISS
jgi:hypothetical protein